MSVGVEAIRRFALLATMLPVLFAGDVLCVRAAIAATYYVTTTGKDTNPGTQAQPFHTIRQGLRVLTAGDTLYLRGGTYAESISHLAQTVPSGSSWANPITIAGYPTACFT